MPVERAAERKIARITAVFSAMIRFLTALLLSSIGGFYDTFIKI